MSSNAMHLAYDVHDSGSPGFVVLLHSLALDRRVWRSLVGPLSRHRTVVSVDLRGHGSSPPGKDFTIEQMAEDVVFTLSSITREPFDVVGLSLGGCVAQALAANHPERVASLALVDTTAWYGLKAREDWQRRADQARQHGMHSLAEFQLTRWFSDDFRLANPSLCSELLEVFSNIDLASYMASCRALGAVDLRRVVGKISAPTVIIVGEDDPATSPAHAADLHSRIRSSQLHELPNARHLTPVERPEEVLALLLPLVSRRAIHDG